jgi:hypothetical protein
VDALTFIDDLVGMAEGVCTNRARRWRSSQGHECIPDAVKAEPVGAVQPAGRGQVIEALALELASDVSPLANGGPFIGLTLQPRY